MTSNLLHFLFLQKKENNVQYLLPDETYVISYVKLLTLKISFIYQKTYFCQIGNLCYV